MTGNWNQSGATWRQGNFSTGNTTVDLNDLVALTGNWGKTVGAAAGAGAAVPEPMTLSLLALGGVALLRRRK
jgi:hypothetical protein